MTNKTTMWNLTIQTWYFLNNLIVDNACQIYVIGYLFDNILVNDMDPIFEVECLLSFLLIDGFKQIYRILYFLTPHITNEKLDQLPVRLNVQIKLLIENKLIAVVRIPVLVQIFLLRSYNYNRLNVWCFFFIFIFNRGTNLAMTSIKYLGWVKLFNKSVFWLHRPALRKVVLIRSPMAEGIFYQRMGSMLNRHLEEFG